MSAFNRLISQQPGKTVYVSLSFLTLFVRLPWWTARNLLPSWRPRQSWSLKQCLFTEVIRFLTQIDANVHGLFKDPDHLALDTSKGVLGVYVDGVPELLQDDIKGWASIAGVQPTRLPGYWLHAPTAPSLPTGAPPAPGEKVLYFLHGGGFTLLSAHPKAISSGLPRTFISECAPKLAADAGGGGGGGEALPLIRRSFAVEYRLSAHTPRPPANPFPAALIDALAGYAYLTNVVGFAPRDIVVVGDSAGGNLALALARYLVAHKEVLPECAQPPGALLLLSPWTDMSRSHTTPGSSQYTHQRSDFDLGPTLANSDYPPRAYVGPHGLDEAARNPYISPASKELPEGVGSFKGFPRTMIVSGDAEILLDQIRTVKERMERDTELGTVEYVEVQDASHDFLIFPQLELGRRETLAKITEWLRTL